MLGYFLLRKFLPLVDIEPFQNLQKNSRLIHNVGLSADIHDQM